MSFGPQRPQQSWIGRNGLGSGQPQAYYAWRNSVIPPRQPQLLPSIGSQYLVGNNHYLLDARFKTRKKAFFCEGRVFWALWAEPAGSGSKLGGDIVLGKYGEHVVHKIKRFVVFRSAEKHCEVLMISSYDGRACTKDGITKTEHARIYTGKICPEPLQGELPQDGKAGILELALQVIPDNAKDQEYLLSPESRVDFGKTRSFEYNCRVRSLGKLAEDAIVAMRKQYQGLREPEYGNILAHQVIHKTIYSSATEGVEEPTNKDYHIQLNHEEFYRFANIFCLLTWKDTNSSDEGYDDTLVTQELVGLSDEGARLYANRRWFVVLENQPHLLSCLCLPIVSYDGEGVRDGYIKAYHSMLYLGRQVPLPTKAEMTPSSDHTMLGPNLRVRQNDLAMPLKEAARVRYNTVYRVSYQVKACAWGHVSSYNRHALPEYFNRLFSTSMVVAECESSDDDRSK